ATAAAAPTSAKAKKIAKIAGAAVFTFAMFGAVALPAYGLGNAGAEAETVDFSSTQASVSQTIKVTAGAPLVAIDDVPLEVATSVVEQEQRERAIAEAQEAAASNAAREQQAAANAIDIPAGSGASGLVNAAL